MEQSEPNLSTGGTDKAFDFIVWLLAFVTGAVAVWELFPKWGYLPLILIAVGWLYYWVRSDIARFWRVWSSMRQGMGNPRRTFVDWWQPAFAILLLLFCGVCYVVGWMPINWGRASYLSEHQQLALNSP